MMGDRNPLNSTTCKRFFWFCGSKKEALCAHTHTHQGFCGGRILWAEKLALVCKERDEEEEGKGKKNQRLENKTQTNVMSICKKKEEEEDEEAGNIVGKEKKKKGGENNTNRLIRESKNRIKE
jgi:hypothetical protein